MKDARTRDGRTTHRALIGTGTPNSKGVLVYTVKSENRPGITHMIAVQPYSGRVSCTCEDFQCRCRAHKPTVAFGPVCKHVRTYKAALLRDALAATPTCPVRADFDTRDNGRYSEWTFRPDFAARLDDALSAA